MAPATEKHRRRRDSLIVYDVSMLRTLLVFARLRLCEIQRFPELARSCCDIARIADLLHACNEMEDWCTRVLPRTTLDACVAERATHGPKRSPSDQHIIDVVVADLKANGEISDPGNAALALYSYTTLLRSQCAFAPRGGRWLLSSFFFVFRLRHGGRGRLYRCFRVLRDAAALKHRGVEHWRLAWPLFPRPSRRGPIEASRRGALAARLAHNQEEPGSIPGAAISQLNERRHSGKTWQKI